MKEGCWCSLLAVVAYHTFKQIHSQVIEAVMCSVILCGSHSSTVEGAVGYPCSGCLKDLFKSSLHEGCGLNRWGVYGAGWGRVCLAALVCAPLVACRERVLGSVVGDYQRHESMSQEGCLNLRKRHLKPTFTEFWKVF